MDCFIDFTATVPGYDYLAAVCAARAATDGPITFHVVKPPGVENCGPWQNVILPGLEMACKSESKIYDKRAEPIEGAMGYAKCWLGSQAHYDLIKSGKVALKAKDYLIDYYREKYGTYVTITLRQAPHWPTRNSNIETWTEVALAMRSAGLNVKVIRDWHFSRINEADRAALYAGSQLNMGVSNGPLWVSLALGAKTLACKLIVEDANFCSSLKGWQKAGFPIGCDMGENVKFLWDHDDSDPKPIITAALDLLNGVLSQKI